MLGGLALHLVDARTLSGIVLVPQKRPALPIDSQSTPRVAVSENTKYKRTSLYLPQSLQANTPVALCGNEFDVTEVFQFVVLVP